ncbi:hypothetical protein ZWY2020_020491 [Hordeum vulgare]|nr:hypothetical protein ZWY2020_020491 [Hordeum vulgare]
MPAPAPSLKPHPPPPDWIKGLSFHCSRPRHQAVDCRDPVTCMRCFRSGHFVRGYSHAPRPHLRPGAPCPRQAPPLPRPRPELPPPPPQAGPMAPSTARALT